MVISENELSPLYFKSAFSIISLAVCDVILLNDINMNDYAINCFLHFTKINLIISLTKVSQENSCFLSFTLLEKVSYYIIICI